MIHIARARASCDRRASAPNAPTPASPERVDGAYHQRALVAPAVIAAGAEGDDAFHGREVEALSDETQVGVGHDPGKPLRMLGVVGELNLGALAAGIDNVDRKHPQPGVALGGLQDDRGMPLRR